MSLAAPAPNSSLVGRPPRDWGRDTLLDLAYEEYLDLLREGRTPQIAEFCAKFPGLEESLAGLLECHHELDAWAEQQGPDGWPLAVAQPKGFHDLKLIARGPLSSVYLAREDDEEGQPVILKLSKMGAAEASVHAGLDRKRHANIAAFLSHRTIQDGWTLAIMPYQGNLTLADLLQQLVRARGMQRPRAVLQAALEDSGRVWHEVTGLPVACPKVRDYQEAVLTWAEKLASALVVVHAKYAHGDIKPANVLLKPDGDPLLLDFNLARSEGSAQPPGGTLLYMAPELLDAYQQGPAAASSLDYRRADQYAFGVMLIQLLTGQHPYAPGPMPKGTTRELAEGLRRAIDLPAARQWDRFSMLDGELRQLLRRCVAVDPKDRWQDFVAIHNELQRRRERRSRRRWFALAASVTLTVAAAAAWPLVAQAFAEPVSPASVRLTLKQGELNRALDEASHLIASGIDRAEGHYLRAVALERLGKPQGAIAELQASLAEHETPERRALLGYYYGLPEINEGPGLRRECERAQALGDKTAANFNNLGYGYLKAPRYDLALECLNRAIELDPSLATAYRNRARCYLTLAEASGGDRAKYLPLAMQDCSLMLAQLQGGEVHFEAASTFAAVAKQDPSTLTDLLRQVEQAVRHGIPANRFQSPSFRAFRSLPGFQQALASVPIAMSLTSPPKVVRPKLDD